MKKFIFYIFLTVVSFQISFAQTPNTLIPEFLNSENARYEIIDKETIEASLSLAKAADSTGMLTPQIPSFMEKLDMIQVLDLSSCSEDVKNKFADRYNAIEDDNGYETLISAEDETDQTRILIKKDGSLISEILILAVANDNSEIVIVKVSGEMDESDVEDIVKQQTK